jgi:uncharacterized protein YdeI (YjbR/CyaY-like superfamily)
MIKTDRFEKIEVHSQEELRTWLLNNHRQKESIWLVTFKKHHPNKYVSREEVLDEILCFGWIDGIRRKLDEDKTMQLLSPRKAQHWAKSYKDRAKKLIAEEKMHSSGLQCIEDAKKSGLWHFMDDVDALIKPKDLINAFKKYPGSAAFFDSNSDSSKRWTLRWIKMAKTEKTRQKRIHQTALLAARGEKVPQS